MLKSFLLIGIRTLLESFNFRLILAITALSVAIIGAHKMGALDIEKDLLQETNFVTEYTYSSKNIHTQHFHNNNNVYTVVCEPKSQANYSYCGLAFALHEHWPETGVDLSRYHTLELKIALQAKVPEPRVRVSFRNFNDHYSTVDDPVSLKFNSISYAPSKYPGTIRVPLNSFQVESWWVEQQKIEFANAQLDFSNIAIVEFVTDTLDEKSNATLTISEAKLNGELISERALIWSLIAFALVTVSIMIAMQHYKLHIASITDTLTGLFNRRGIHDWAESATSLQFSESNMTMFYFDIDDFKKVNDSYGHMAGDQLLRAFCSLVKNVIDNSGLVNTPHAFSRLSGDEFALLVRDLTGYQIETLANKIMYAAHKPVELSSGSLNLNFSLGIATSDNHTKSFDALLSNADSAMYHAKKRGKGQYKIFDESVALDVSFRKMVAEKLAHSLQKEQFFLVYMPIYDTQSLEIVCCEVLLRCSSKDLQGIGPDRFIPIAEQYDLIDKIDSWVLENTFKDIVRFTQNKKAPQLVFSINISASQLHNKQFVERVKKLVEKYKIDTKLIEFEITETSLIETDIEAIETLKELKDMGISLSLDDFGTGYTAFNQLINYPVDCLKMDKSFTDQLLEDKNSDVVMVNAILSIANSYKLKTTAEGIEHKYQLDYMNSHNCDRVQGFYFSKPLIFDDFMAFCIDHVNSQSSSNT